jgi:hypothetical protein
MWYDCGGKPPAPHGPNTRNRPVNQYDSAPDRWFSEPAPAGEETAAAPPPAMPVARYATAANATATAAPRFWSAGFGSLKRGPEELAALDRVREWTRARFALSEEAAILVAEVACGLPGCPPVETVVAFWTAGDARHQFKVFKPARDVVEDDLPFAWLKEALVALDGMDCDCC